MAPDDSSPISKWSEVANWKTHPLQQQWQRTALAKGNKRQKLTELKKGHLVERRAAYNPLLVPEAITERVAAQ